MENHIAGDEQPPESRTENQSANEISCEDTTFKKWKKGKKSSKRSRQSGMTLRPPKVNMSENVRLVRLSDGLLDNPDEFLPPRPMAPPNPHRILDEESLNTFHQRDLRKFLVRRDSAERGDRKGPNAAGRPLGRCSSFEMFGIVPKAPLEKGAEEPQTDK